MRSVLARAAVVVLLALVVAPGQTAGPVAAAEAQEPGVVRLTAGPDSSIGIDGAFPPRPDECAAKQPRNLHAAYRGILEIGRRANGKLYLVAELTFAEYLSGIAEVPRSWPLESLKAQVVAARTYAIKHLNPSDDTAKELRYDLCATDACQVFRGLNVEKGAWGEAWVRAVTETTGEVLEHDGKTANTFYFSTSNGQTYSNVDAFGGTALPYLKPVQETDDTASPVSSWNVRMPLEDLAATLKRRGLWEGPMDSIEQRGGSVHLAGGGRTAELTLEDLRIKLNNESVCLTPKRYPTKGANGRNYPQVIPSKWYSVKQEGREAVFDGRGWGHGVGMVQWGAYGKAQRGMSHADILAFYYGGLRPVAKPEPDRIRVALATNLDSIVIERRGDVQVSGATLPEGPVKFMGGDQLKTESASPIAPLLKVNNLTVTSTTMNAAPGVTGTAAALGFELSDPARVRVKYEGPTSGTGPEEPRDRGATTLNWDDPAVPAGTYKLTIEAADGVDNVTSEPVEVQVERTGVAPPKLTATAQADDAGPSPGPRLALFAALALAAAGGGAFWVKRNRRKRGALP
ncbi:MAG TPA: SpoIID/LytB domain-containing protein [Actinomycetota bacterium]|nr:SpoIID/LytB domain-containing protein [Actinomycetota bacterium]